MRASTRIWLWKIGLPAGLLIAVLAAMHFVLPGLATLREQQRLGDRYELVETERLRLWLPKHRPHARVLSEAVPRFAAALYESYGEALALRPLRERITLRVFLDQEELARHARQRGMTRDMSNTIGYYSPREWSVALTLLPRPQLVSVACHEVTHLLMHRPDRPNRAQRSLWLIEGAAVFFEHSRLDGSLRLGGVDPRAAREILVLAEAGEHVPLRELAAGGQELFASDRAPLAYMEAGTLVAFLLDGAEGRHREGFLNYYREELDHGARSPEVLEHHLGLSLSDLEEQWLAFLEGHRE